MSPALIIGIALCAVLTFFLLIAGTVFAYKGREAWVFFVAALVPGFVTFLLLIAAGSG